MDNRLKQARDHLAGTQRATADAERNLQAERNRLANSGKLHPVKTVELGHEVTRYEGDITAYFAPFMQGVTWRGRINRLPIRKGK